MSGKSEDEKDAIIDKFRIIGYGSIALLLYVALAFFFPLQDPSSTSPPKPNWVAAVETQFGGFAHVIVEARSAFGSALVGFFALSAVLQVLQYTSLKRQVRETLSDTISMSREFFDQLSDPSKRAFLENSLRTTMGDEVGAAAFDQLGSFLYGRRSFRKNFRYHISFNERGKRPNSLTPAAREIFGDPKYRWVEETISYKRYFPHDKTYDTNDPVIVLAFDDRSYEDVFSKEDVFYRLIMEADKMGIEKIEELSTQAIKDFVQLDCGLSVKRVSEGQADEEFQLKITKGQSKKTRQPIIQIVATGLNLRAEDAVQVSLCYPYNSDAGHYTVTLPDPCDSPSISFQAARDMQSVDHARFMTSIDGKDIIYYRHGSHGTHTIDVQDSWIFPTSGVSFFWKENDG